MNPGDVVYVRTPEGCVFGRLVRMGRVHATIQRQGHPTKTHVPAESVKPWPPAPVEATTTRVRRK